MLLDVVRSSLSSSQPGRPQLFNLALGERVESWADASSGEGDYEAALASPGSDGDDGAPSVPPAAALRPAGSGTDSEPTPSPTQPLPSEPPSPTMPPSKRAARRGGRGRGSAPPSTAPCSVHLAPRDFGTTGEPRAAQAATKVIRPVTSPRAAAGAMILETSSSSTTVVPAAGHSGGVRSVGFSGDGDLPVLTASGGLLLNPDGSEMSEYELMQAAFNTAMRANNLVLARDLASKLKVLARAGS